MPYLVSLIAPRDFWDFVRKNIITVVLCNLFAFLIVFLVHGYLPSGLRGQLIETTLIALPFGFGFLKIIAYLYELQTELYRVAHIDVLTGLPNRRAFLSALNDRIASGEAGSLILADADHFKQINDRYGHDGGDVCLRAIGTRLREIKLDDDDAFARIGGEEFALLLTSTSCDDVVRIGEQLVAEIPFVIENVNGARGKPHVTLSAGWVKFDGSSSASHVMSVADRRLYLAKEAGRAQCFFTDAIDQSGETIQAGFQANS